MADPAFRVRRAEAGDAAAIAEVHARTWQAAYEHVFGAERLAAREPDVALWTRILANERVEVTELRYRRSLV